MQPNVVYLLFAAVFCVATGLGLVSYYFQARTRQLYSLLEMTTTCTDDSDVDESLPPPQQQQREEEMYDEYQEIRDRLERIDDKVNAIWEKLQEIARPSPVSSHSIATAAAVAATPQNDEPGEGDEPLESALTHPTDGGDAGCGYLIIW